jgi:hypothetical protein
MNIKNSMATTATLLNADDPLIDMVFITTYTNMTDKFFFKLIKTGNFRNPSNWDVAALA